MANSDLSVFNLDLLCAIKYLSDDRRAKALPTLTDIAIFLRGSDLSRRKAFTHKYDLYGKYETITNDEVKSSLDELVSEQLVRSKGVYSLTKEGTAVIAEHRPEALDNPYIKANEAVERGEEYQYIGQYACYYRLDVFRKSRSTSYLIIWRVTIPKYHHIPLSKNRYELGLIATRRCKSVSRQCQSNTKIYMLFSNMFFLTISRGQSDPREI